MKLQNFAIIFALIAIPLILVLTYYIQLQVDTIALQNKYDAMLLNSVHDAVSSFEINTANEDLSSVSDSLRTIIEASNNVFFNTLSTNLGLSNASKAYVEPYVPAILYTLYDGYYISSPTQVPEVLTDPEERAVAVGDLGVEMEDNNYKYTHTTSEEVEKCQACSSAIARGNVTPHYFDDSGTIKELSYKDAIGADYGQLLYTSKDSEDNKKYTYTANVNDAKLTTKNVLKTYMPYSARYKNEDGEPVFDITVIYTLDNYVTIEGLIGSVYYTKSGYLIPQNSIEKITDKDDNSLDNLINYYSQEDAENYIKNNSVKITIDGINIESGENGTYEELTNTLTALKNNLEQATLTNNLSFNYSENRKEINNTQYELDKMSAVIYYVKAQIFSKWVYENLLQVQEKNIVEISGISSQDYNTKNKSEQITYNFENSEASVFDTGTLPSSSDGEKIYDYEGVAEIPVNSPFYSHKLNVIRNSIQYNLNLAMSTYNEQTSNTYQYEMPIIQSEEWNKILNNVSVVAFMQGYPCKLKTYNNYKIVSSTNNEIAVSPRNIFYVPKENFNDEQSEYHRIDCEKLPSSTEERNITGYMSFSSKEVKYDRTNSSDNSTYLYDHKNFACYDCVNDGNYIERRVNIFEITGNEDIDNKNKLKKQAYYIAVGKEKNNLYKMNAIDNSQGYEVIYDKINEKNRDSNSPGYTSTRHISDIKQIEIVLGTIKTSNIKENLRYEYVIDGSSVDDDFVKPNSISSNESSNTTLILKLNPNVFGNKNIDFSKEILTVENKNETQSTTYLNTPGDNVDDNKIFQNAIKYIRVIYK